MSTLDLFFLSVALAMDCFTISIVSGVVIRQKTWRVILQMSFFFGIFQAFMPLIGWAVARRFAHHIEAYDHWLAFGLLAFLGIRMIKEALQPEEKEHHFNPQKIKTQLLLAIATSIDALAVGITFAFIGYRNLSQLALPLAMIGGVSVISGFTGTLLGIRFGRSINHRLQPELAGGIILCLIGTKILISHLTA